MNIQIKAEKGVPVQTILLRGITTAANILEKGYSLQMLWIDTMPLSAYVVNCKTLSYWSFEVFKRPTMRQVTSVAPNMKPGVSA